MLISSRAQNILRHYHQQIGVSPLNSVARWSYRGFFDHYRTVLHTNYTPFAFSRPHLKCFKRTYNPIRHIDWVGVRLRWRNKQLLMRKRKHKNHPRVSMRFRLTRFGWERLQQGRRGKKLHLSGQQRRNKKRIKFVSRHDLVKLKRQMPGYRLRIRDPPFNNNPNIQSLRNTINNYFA